MTAMEASDQGYGVVIASDANGNFSEKMQNAFLCSFQRLWGRVMTTDEIVEEMNRAAVDSYSIER
jgi:biuret amidohydrolase